jgi:hypothetical protein
MLVLAPDTFTPVQLVCLDYIERLIVQITNEWYAADWMMELDLELYAELTKPESRYVEMDIFRNMQTCSDHIGGWIAWDDEQSSPRFFTHEEIKNKIQQVLDTRKK